MLELAIKVLPADLAQDEERRSRFIREAQPVARLKHPNILTIRSVEEVDGTAVGRHPWRRSVNSRAHTS